MDADNLPSFRLRRTGRPDLGYEPGHRSRTCGRAGRRRRDGGRRRARRRVARELATAGPAVHPHRLDVTDVGTITVAVDQVVSDHGALDIVVANAGLGDNHPALDVTESDWDRMMAVNLRGLFFTCQAAGRRMIERGRGRVIAMSSQASVVGIRDHAVYSASKGGVNQLVRVLALEWGPRGVTVNAVAPAFIYTPGTADRLVNGSILMVDGGWTAQ